MGKWQLGIVGVFLLVFALTVLITGHPGWIVAPLILAVLIAGYALANQRLAHKIVDEHHHGDVDEANADNEEIGLPATHLTVDDERPLGDTPEAHDEINPHDLPQGHPGRQAAEEQAGDQEGTTGGHAEGAAGGGESQGSKAEST
jgi:hypothetical protein